MTTMTTSTLLDTSEESMKPQMAIIVNRVGSSFYLERRDIVNGEMRAAIPLTKECIKEIANTFTSEKEEIIHGNIPSKMLYADCRRGRERYAWYRPAEERQMYFTKKLNIKTGKMQIPGILYSVTGNLLSVYVFKGRQPKDKLYKAPFFNVHDSGSVCLGNAKLKKPKELTYESVMHYWEELFWKSEFAGLLGTNPIKGNLTTITRQCIKTGCKFPEDVLLPAKITFKKVVRI